jgi:hypothetical protein
MSEIDLNVLDIGGFAPDVLKARDEAVAAAIRARGVAKPRTDGEAPAAADEGAKS